MLTPARIAVLVSGGGTNLQALLDAQRDGKMPHGEIVLVVSSRAGVHFVNEIPDGGEILLQKAVEIAPDDTPETLQRRVMEQAEWQMLPLAAERVCAEIVREKEQKND